MFPKLPQYYILVKNLMVATSSQNKIKHVLGKQHTQHCKSGLFLQIILQRLGFIIDGVNSVRSEEKHLYFF